MIDLTTALLEKTAKNHQMLRSPSNPWEDDWELTATLFGTLESIENTLAFQQLLSNPQKVTYELLSF